MDEAILTAAATANAFRERAQALRVVLLLDLGRTVMIDCDAAGTEVTDRGSVTAITGSAAPKPLPDLRPTPASAISLDLETGELAAPLGTVQHLADAVTALARAFGGRTVATAEFATRDPELPITFAAREGEPVVLEAGDAQYQVR
jgi:hypothetical protein